MRNTRENTRDTSGAFNQMQAIVCELSGFADILDERQDNMKAAEFHLSEHFIRLIRQLGVGSG